MLFGARFFCGVKLIRKQDPGLSQNCRGNQKPHSKLAKYASLEWGTLSYGDPLVGQRLLRSGGFAFRLERESGFLPRVEPPFERPNIAIAMGLELLRQTGA